MGYIRYNVIRINLNVFCAMKAKSKGTLIQTGTNVLPGCSTVMIYNVVQVGLCKS